ncbi:MAG: RagB/SusD family nutrient uptake outer membrane protein [Cyclobacteriaceae bacterium]
MKMLKYTYTLLLTLSLISCEIGQQIDPNSPSIITVGDNANIAQLNNLVTGTLFQMRTEVNVYLDEVGVIGREMYRFSGSDPRWHSDLLAAATLDNNAFYTTRPFGARYRTIKNANILIDAVNNTEVVTDAERNGYLGFAKTIIAHELLILTNLQYENGIRLQVTDPDNLGPFVSKDEALNFIANLLDEANADLNGAEFILPLSFGFVGFETPETFSQFNRALASRVAAYRGAFAQVLTELDDSFLDLGGSLTKGATLVFSQGAGDVTNPFFLPADNTGENRLAHPGFIEDALSGDTRISKALERTPEADDGPGPVTVSDLTSNFDVWLYRSNTDPIPLVRNEELILLYAEAKIQTGEMLDAVTALNIIRNAYGLADYSGGMDQASLVDEMLFQRRYSLWNEGHRWVDMRRYNRLNQLPLDRVGDVVHTQFPRPEDEVGVQGG